MSHEPATRPAKAGHADQPPAGLALSLRTLTALHHRGAEQSGFQQLMATGRLPKEAYVAWLGQMLVIHATLESLLQAAGATALGGFQVGDWKRTPQLAADLASWGSRPDLHPPLPATRDFQERLAAWSSVPYHLLGVLYVLEGSANGGRFIAASLRKAWQIEGNEGLRYLDPHGEAQQAKWARFKQELDEAVPRSEGARLVETAQATFEAISALGKDLLETLST